MTPKMAVVAPSPSASVSTAAAVKLGLRSRLRNERRKSEELQKGDGVITAPPRGSPLYAARDAVDGAVLGLDRDGTHHWRAGLRAHARELHVHAGLQRVVPQ